MSYDEDCQLVTEALRASSGDWPGGGAFEALNRMMRFAYELGAERQLAWLRLPESANPFKAGYETFQGKEWLSRCHHALSPADSADIQSQLDLEKRSHRDAQAAEAAE